MPRGRNLTYRMKHYAEKHHLIDDVDKLEYIKNTTDIIVFRNKETKEEIIIDKKEKGIITF